MWLSHSGIRGLKKPLSIYLIHVNQISMPVINKSTDKQSLRWLFKQARPARNWVYLSVGLGFAGGLLLVVQAGFMAGIIQGVFMDNLPRGMMLPLFAGLAVAVVLRAGLAWGREVTGFMAGAKIREEIRMTLMERIVELGPAYTGRQKTGELSSAVLEQVEGLHDFFALYLPQLALVVLIPLTIVAFVFPLSWAAGVLLLLAAPLIPVFTILVGMGAESISQRNFQALARLSAHFLDVLQGLTTLKLFGRSRVEADNVARVAADYRKQTMRVLRVAFLSSAVLEFFTSMAIALVAVYLGLRFLGFLNFGDYGRALNLAGGFFILLLAPDFFLPLRELGTHYHARAEAVGAAKEILKVLSVSRQDRPVPKAQLTAGESIGIGYDNIYFSYDADRRPVLANIRFELKAGEHAALVGASGAGKTTILNLLMGFIRPQRGDILVNGISLSTLAPDSWRSRLAWIGQSPVLFHGTIRENILLGRPDAGHSDLVAAARAARVIEFCRLLPAGLDTPVGEQGIGLSRGQAQPVALARAFLKDAPVVLLDEPTAGLDAENEHLVLGALERLTQNRTVLMATHRPENIARADRILVLSDGQIAEQGTYTDLIEPGTLFFRLANQASRGGNHV
jgi:ATP-binding cassette subfamily C protein CydD